MGGALAWVLGAGLAWAVSDDTLAGVEETPAAPPPVEEVAEAPTPRIPRDRLFWELQAAGRLNPLGLIGNFKLQYRRMLFQSDSRLLKDSYLSAGLVGNLTPAFTRVGLGLQFQPVAVLTLQGSYEVVGWLNSFDQLQAFTDPRTADYSDPALDAGESRFAYGGLLHLQARAQAQVGPMVLRNAAQFYRYDARLDAGEVAFYELQLDLLVPNKGWAFSNDLDLIGLVNDHLRIGARYSVGMAFHPGDVGQADEATHRVGPLIAWRFHDRPGTRFDQPTLNLLVQWHAVHPYRAGQVSHQAYPLIGIGLTAQGDFFKPLPDPPKKRRKGQAGL